MYHHNAYHTCAGENDAVNKSRGAGNKKNMFSLKHFVMHNPQCSRSTTTIRIAYAKTTWISTRSLNKPKVATYSSIGSGGFRYNTFNHFCVFGHNLNTRLQRRKSKLSQQGLTLKN